MADSKEKSGRPQPKPNTKIIKEGGYQPTTDPGPVPTSLIRPATEKPAENPSQPQDKQK
jgi:hypothetical protein